MNKQRYIKADERGMASIIVASIVMIITSLITIGFARIMSREYRQALDRQLSTQAFYAAESGINEAARALDSNPLFEKTDCQDGSFNYNISDTVSFSCLLVDPTPTDVIIDTVPVIGRGEPVVFPLEPESTENITEFRIFWDQTANGVSANLPSNGTPVLPQNNIWGDRVGILRVDLVPTDSYSRENLINNGFSFQLYPTSNAAGEVEFTPVPGTTDKGAMFLTECSSSGLRCQARILLGGTARNRYSMRLQAYYNNVRVVVRDVKSAASGEPLELKNAQAVIDSTGKVTDVLRRIQVRLPLTETYFPATPFALSTGDSICKRIVLTPGGVVYGDTNVPADLIALGGVCNNSP